ELEDACVLLMYIFGAHARGLARIELAEILGWANALANNIDAKLARGAQPSAKCSLLTLRGSVASIRPLGSPLVELVSDVLMHWARVPEALAKASMFPVERFADQLALLAGAFADSRQYRALARRVDRIVAK